MLIQKNIMVKQTSLLPEAVSSRDPAARASCAPRQKRETKRRGISPPCSSNPHQWRTVPTHHPGSARRLGPQDDGPPALVSATFWSLGALLAFNLLRSIVLMWISGQQRSSRLRKSTAALAAAATETMAAGGGSPPSTVNLTRAATNSDGPIAADIVPLGSEAAVAEAVSPDGRKTQLLGAESGAGKTWGPVSATPAEGSTRPITADAEGSQQCEETAISVGGGAVGSSVQIANYQLRPRGSRSNKNLGRVVICATVDLAPEPEYATGQPASGSVPGPGSNESGSDAADGSAAWGSSEWHQRFWEPLLNKYAGSQEDRVTGLLLLYGTSVLHIMEGDNNQLFALLRELRPGDVGMHRLREVRVPCYILDLRERLFENWQCAVVSERTTGQRRLTRAAFKSPITFAMSSTSKGDSKAAIAATATGPAGRLSQFSPITNESQESKEQPPAQPPEQQLVTRIQQLELFIKFVGPKLSTLATPASRSQALRNLSDYETTTPPEDVVAALATDSLAPELQDFVTAFDADYHRYVSLLALVAELEAELEDEGVAMTEGGGRARLAARASSLLGEIRHLSRFYKEHVQRELKDAFAQNEEERRGRGVDEVTRRLYEGMRL